MPPLPGDSPPPRPRSAHPSEIGFTPRERVRWLAPGMLVRTGAHVVLSALIGGYFDRRELQGIESSNPLDLSAPEALSEADGDFWLDYVADLGDGFDATTTVASQLAKEELELTDGERRYLTRGGSLLVMGGDQCYPIASRANYRDRLVGPYRMMLPWTDRPRKLVALPGNHDWYDGLTSFLRQFCQGRWIGGWQTVQSRSYFAVKLPGGWWLWGVDMQLGEDIDQPQLSYFREIAARLEPEDRIILCWATPAWVRAEDDPDAYDPMEYFERSVIPDRRMLRVTLSGDYHHYARYLGPEEGGQHKITAGGGGAYLYATHQLPETLRLPPAGARGSSHPCPPVTYELRERYPSRETSRRLRWGVFGSIYRNRGFCLVPAVVYLLIGVAIRRAFPNLGQPDWWAASVPELVVAIVLVAALWFGLAAFTGLSRRENPLRRWLLSGMHTAAHLALIVAVVVGVELATASLAWHLLPRMAAVPLVSGLVGALLGPAVVAGYLVLADGVRPNGVNTNELFSAQAIPDYKCFLRLRISADGTLTIFPVKIERAVRWEFAGSGDDAGSVSGPSDRWFRPVDGAEPVAELIEPPIVVPKRVWPE